MSDSAVDVGAASARLENLLQVQRPAVYFANKIGDSVLTLPTLRALGQLFAAPLTVICPKFAYDLCFWEVGGRHVDITELLPPQGLSLELPPRRRAMDCEAVAAEIGPLDVFINIEPWNLPSNTFLGPLRELLAATTSIGFRNHVGDYDLVVPREMVHAADLTFKMARLFDPAAEIETYAHPVPCAPAVQAHARRIRAEVPAGMKVLVVHADTDWAPKQWPVTRFVDVLDRFLSRHSDYVAWIVGMGLEELNVGRERDRVVPFLGLPLDLSMSLVANADLFVGIDSCMLHAADLARVPGVGLFGPTRSLAWGFRFTPHRHVDLAAMADITVAEVLNALEDLVAQHV